MTIIVVRAAATVAQVQAAGHENLGSCVERALSTAQGCTGENLEVKQVLFTDTQAPVANWQQRLVGNQDVTVVAETRGTLPQLVLSMSETLQSVLTRLADHDAQLASGWALRLRNVNAQLLLHACGKQEFRTTTSDCYTKMLEQQDLGLERLAQRMGMDAAAVAQQADDLLTRRNCLTHPGSLEVLEQEVNEVLGHITPALRQMCPQECQFLQAYNDIKCSFPERFR
ncbi:hypothetical protein Agub_g7189 [Astrephomene gubernaculifera]|uniref:Uncharacterized protein n=1 Tax=Astrephomene gubernaculifera TaxID=47775 RepID=A0AAD3DPW4_9CHLO|nr:hypothetical protein Agub_g7189 [Astrephomene gubernaculifera]